MNWKTAAFAATIGLFLCIAAAAQGDAFAIQRGAMFSASSSANAKKPGASKHTALNAISADVEEMLRIVRANHASAKRGNDGKLIGSAIASMLEQLDPHSNYYTPKEFRELNDGHRGRYFGIGTTISDIAGDGGSETFILAVKPNAPAERAGLRFGDRIVSVNGRSVAGMNSLEVRDLVRGPLNTTVRLSVERADGTFIPNIAVKRAQVTERSVSAAIMLEPSVGYIALTDGFDNSTAEEFDAAFGDLKSKGMRSLIIDLRGNGGGLMEQAIMIAERFLPAGGAIVSQRGRYAAEDREWRSRNQRPENLPLAILVDGGTASASEILAAAFQDNDRATIVGTRTFGKGLVQSLISLSDGSGLTLTSERYYTPAGRSIQREYSDGGLYDYFRQTNKGILIDKPEFAVKTRGGRTVFSGNGIQPDLLINGPENNAFRTTLRDRIFHAIRRGDKLTGDDELLALCRNVTSKVGCGDELAFLRVNAARFNAFKNSGNEIFLRDSVRFDPQAEAAIGLLKGMPTK